MKNIIFLLAALSIFSCSSQQGNRWLASSSNPVEAMMSPTKGKEAFERIYTLIREAKKDINITIYSWSDKGLSAVLKEVMDREDPPILRVVMKKGVFEKQADLIAELEKKGAMFKKAKIELHEKFVLVDDNQLLNSSANMSGGAKYKYNENFVFFDARGEAKNSDVVSLIKDFRQEFAVIWNSAHDYVTPGEKTVADVLNHRIKRANKYTALKNLSLLSTSMNYKIGPARKKDFEKGSVIGLKRLPNKAKQIWMVKDALIKAIRKAKSSILININHFNIREISDELIKAVKRGIEVKFVVDSQEFRVFLNNREMTPQFVKDYLALETGKDIPVRIKFYSFYPHHSRWYLNHHKYMLVDHGTESAFLLTGSYNYSKTAEHSKFDNQVVFKGKEYTHIYDAFKAEFDYLWDLERTTTDTARMKNTKYLLKVVKGKLPIHTKKPFSLKWEEATKLLRTLQKKFPASKKFYKFKQCSHFEVDSGDYFKPDGSICE